MIDVVQGIDDLLPPVAAHKEERKDQANAKHNGGDVATVVFVVLIEPITNYLKRCLVERYLNGDWGLFRLLSFFKLFRY